MNAFVLALQWVFLLFFIVGTVCALALNLLAIPALRRRAALQAIGKLPPPYPGFAPPVSLLVPVCEDEAGIVDHVRGLLALDYPEFEVLVISDGARDGSLQALVDAFGLTGFPEVYWRRITAQPVRTIYHSTMHKNLRVVDKEHGGRADALNVGINASRYPLICAVDRRCLLLRDSLRRVAEPFLDDPALVASASTMGLASARNPIEGITRGAELPSGLTDLMQVVEHLRTLQFSPLGWAALDASLIVDDAFTVVRKDAAVEAGGYLRGAVSENMELLARLHRVMRARGDKCPVQFVPEPICWAEAPATLGGVKAERMYRQQGLAQCLHLNAGLLETRHAGGPAGLLAYPFLMVFECYGPFVELAAYAIMLALWAGGLVSGTDLGVFLVAIFALGLVSSLSAILLEELSYGVYPQRAQLGRLVLGAVVENVGYRQLVAAWRLIALARYLRGERVAVPAY